LKDLDEFFYPDEKPTHSKLEFCPACSNLGIYSRIAHKEKPTMLIYRCNSGFCMVQTFVVLVEEKDE